MTAEAVLTEETAAQQALRGAQTYRRAQNLAQAIENFNATVKFYFNAAADPDLSTPAHVSMGRAMARLVTQVRRKLPDDADLLQAHSELVGNLASDNFKETATQADNPGMANLHMLAHEVAFFGEPPA